VQDGDGIFPETGVAAGVNRLILNLSGLTSVATLI
jgi:hypothetical protein